MIFINGCGQGDVYIKDLRLTFTCYRREYFNELI